jgi:hypothetical protein
MIAYEIENAKEQKDIILKDLKMDLELLFEKEHEDKFAVAVVSNKYMIEAIIINSIDDIIKCIEKVIDTDADVRRIELYKKKDLMIIIGGEDE